MIPNTVHFNEVREYIQDCQNRNVPIHFNYLQRLKEKANEGYQMYLDFEDGYCDHHISEYCENCEDECE